MVDEADPPGAGGQAVELVRAVVVGLEAELLAEAEPLVGADLAASWISMPPRPLPSESVTVPDRWPPSASSASMPGVTPPAVTVTGSASKMLSWSS